MIPEVGSHVKCLMKNNTIAEGIVEEWYGNYVKLKALDGQSYMIIHHPNEDIMLTKVMLDNNSEELPAPDPTPTPPKSQAQVIADKIRAKAEEKVEPIDEQALDAKSKAELQIELAKQEREIVAAKLRDHHVGDVKKVKYGQPGFLPKPRAK